MELPFSLQESIGNGRKLIERVDVLSIDEWNADHCYGNFPIKQVLKQAALFPQNDELNRHPILRINFVYEIL